MSEPPRNRRIDRIRDPSYVDGLQHLALEDLRHRREECTAEREYLSLLRRLLQGRAEILQAELASRDVGDGSQPLVERLSTILAGDEAQTPSRGEMLQVGLPEEEMLFARRRVERLVADAGISDPRALDDGQLAGAVDVLVTEERELSDARRDVIRALDTLLDELKRRYREDPSLAIRTP